MILLNKWAKRRNSKLFQRRISSLNKAKKLFLLQPDTLRTSRLMKTSKWMIRKRTRLLSQNTKRFRSIK